MSLNFNKSICHNDISYDTVSKCFGELCTPLKHIFDLSFEDEIFLDSLKILKVTLEYKFGHSTSLSNYKPIYVLPWFSKILEHIIEYATI